MAGLLEELIINLNKENDLYKSLTNLGSKKTECIVENKIDEIGSLTNDEQRLITDLNRVIKKREEQFKDIAIVLSLDNQEITLNALIDKLEGNESQASLIEVRDEILKNVTEMREVNEENEVLIKQSMEYVEFTLNAIKTSSNISQDNGYYGEEMSSGRNANFFDSKM
ncbi:MAG: flagellar protein FlgN [Clostridia bacterium]|jgi:flagellar biosynthesis/type III secretory pathway chaperone|nr:flagellar protein FlgN [Clostridia bacterium]